MKDITSSSEVQECFAESIKILDEGTDSCHLSVYQCTDFETPEEYLLPIIDTFADVKSLKESSNKLDGTIELHKLNWDLFKGDVSTMVGENFLDKFKAELKYGEDGTSIEIHALTWGETGSCRGYFLFSDEKEKRAILLEVPIVAEKGLERGFMGLGPLERIHGAAFC